MCHVKVEIRCKLSVLLEMCLLSLSSSEAFFFLESAPSEIPNPTKEEGPSCEEPWSPADTAYRHEYPVGRSFAGNDDTCCLIVACHEDRKESHVSRRVSPECLGVQSIHDQSGFHMSFNHCLFVSSRSSLVAPSSNLCQSDADIICSAIHRT